MQIDELPQFAKLMAVLSETYMRETSRALVEIYFRVLQAYTIQEIDAAVYRALTTCVFFPKPAELIQHIHHAHFIEELRQEEEATRQLAQRPQKWLES